MTSCKVNDIFLGEIASVQNYGAFVKIPGCPQQGLIHRTQVSSTHVDDVTEVLQRGERVWCKVISINEDGKIALSMKLVNQGSGKDLDPNGIQLQLDEQKKKAYNPRAEKKAIVLEAVYKTTCTKCKTPGHLAKDCFSTPDGKKYDLLPEVDDEELPASIPQSQIENDNKPKEKKHKSKKSKKKKKHKSSKQTDSDSEDSDSSVDKIKKKRKKSKEHKHQKRKRKNSSSETDSNGSISNYENKKHSKKCKHSREKH